MLINKFKEPGFFPGSDYNLKTAMKRTLTAILFILSFYVKSQSISATYLNQSANSNESNPVVFHLIANLDESLFYSSQVKEKYFESEDKNSYGLPNSFEIRLASKQNYIYKSFDNNQLIEVLSDFQGNYYKLEDSLNIMKWEITEEKKEITNYMCIKATTHFRGRNYEAWFAPEIPFQTGPWKLGNLPGLILEAKEETNLVAYQIDDLKFTKKKSQIELPKSDVKTTSHAAYLDIYLDQLEAYYAFKEAQLRKSGSNIEISIDRDAFQPLEIYDKSKK